jgi:DNA-binding NarL/FixJ family response regulator
VAPVRTAIVCEDSIVRRGVASILADHPDRIQVRPFDDAALQPGQVDVFVYDVVALHLRDGYDLERLTKLAPVLALTRVLRPDLGARAMSHGAAGCISLGASSKQVVKALLRAAAQTGRGPGDAHLDPLPETATASTGTGPEVWQGQDRGLTQRETQVLSLIAYGFSNSRIAEELFVSENTVKSFVRRAYRKIGVTTRSQAVRWAIEHGWAATDAVEPVRD